MKRRLWLLAAAVLLLTIVLIRINPAPRGPDPSTPNGAPTDRTVDDGTAIAPAQEGLPPPTLPAAPNVSPVESSPAPLQAAPRLERQSAEAAMLKDPKTAPPAVVPRETSDLLVFLKPGADARSLARDLGLGVKRPLRSMADAYVFSAGSPAAATAARDRAASDARVRRAVLNRYTRHVRGAFVPNDPYYPNNTPTASFRGQWHLGNGASSTHANLAGAWNRDLTGAGVVIGIVDDGLETTHEDLSPNYVAADSWNFGNDTPDPNANPAYNGTANEDRHGTSVSGVAAARGGNGIGTTGAAPMAGLAGLRVDFPLQMQQVDMFIDATLYHSSGGNTTIKVKNHSYGISATYNTDEADESVAVNTSAAAGTIHLFAAGNERGYFYQDAGKTDPQNNPNAIAVAAAGSNGIFSSYSSFGANVFLTAPSSGVSGFAITTTDRGGNRGYNAVGGGDDPFPNTAYTSVFGGTSSATPLVSGIVALGKQHRPNLDVRFAKHALARSSTQIDPNDSTLTGGGDGTTPGSAWKLNAAGFRFNQNYGFGLVNADQFIQRLIQFDRVTAQGIESVGTTPVGAALPDAPSATVPGAPVVRTFPIATTAPVEEIVVTLDVTHPYRGDVEAFLTSPQGTTCRLFSRANDNGDNINWNFLTNAFWGESPAGTWTLALQDAGPLDLGTWNSFAVTVRTGTVVADTAPPAVVSVSRAAATPTNAGSVAFTVTFDEAVTGVDAADFALTTTGAVSGASIGTITGAAASYTVTVNTGTGDGTIRLDVLDNDSIQDGLANRLGGTGAGNGAFAAGQVYTIDKTPPTVSGVSSPSPNGAYTTSATIPVTVTFLEPVDVTGTPRLQLAVGGGTQANYSGGTASPTLTFTYVVAAGHTAADLDYSSTGALTLNGGTIRDPAGNNAILTLFVPGAPGSLGATRDLVIDTTSPGTPGTPAGAPAVNNGTFTVAWSAASDGAGSGVASYTVRRSDNLGPFNVVAAGVAATTLPQAALPQGSYRYDVCAVDTAGNLGAFSAASTAVTVDTTPPAAPSVPDLLAGDDTGSSATDNLTGLTTLSFSGTAEPDSTVQLFVDGVGGATTTAAGGNWTLVAPGVSAGVRLVTARATDPAGNPGSASGALSVTVDVDPPAPPSLPDLAAASDSGASNADDVTNLTALSFTGTAEAGSTVQLLVDAVAGATTTAPAGSWTLPAPSVAAGVRLIAARATDAAGNTGPASAALSVTVDTAPPAAPSIPDLAAVSDTGDPSDNITSLTTLSFSGTAEDGATVQLFVDGIGGATVVATGGAWTIVAPSVAPGLRSIAARATDPAGNPGPASTPLSVTVDPGLPAAPSIPDLEAASDAGASSTDNLTNLTTLSFSGTADAGSTVQLFVDGVGGATVVATAGPWTLSAASIAPGLRSITARATSPAGNPGLFSGALSVTIDAGVPAAPSAPDLVAASDTGTSSTDNLTSDLTPTFAASGEAGGTLQVFADGVLAATATETTPGSYTATVSSGIADGAGIVFTARVVDAAGNASAPSIGLPVAFDASAPAIPSLPDLAAASDTGPSNSDNMTSLTTLSFSGTAEADALVQLFIDGAPGPTAPATGGSWTIVVPSMAAGPHAVTARSSDGAGNLGAASAALGVTIDTALPAAPSAPDLDPASDSANPDDNLTNLTSLTFTGTAEAGATVQLFVDGVAGATSTATGGAWTLTAPLVAPGLRSVTARATDGAGNLGPLSAPLAVLVDTQAPIVPSVPDLDAAGDTGASSTDNLTSLTTLSFSGTAETDATVQLFVDGVAGPTATAAGGAWTISAGPLATGVRSITARATDAAGNAGPLSIALSVMIDTSLPTTPSVPDLDAASDTGNAADNVTAATAPSFSGSAEAGATVRLFANAAQVGSATADAGGAWTIASSPLAAGTYAFTASSIDGAGNASPPSTGLSVTIDVDPPAAPTAPDLDPAGDTGNPTDDLTSLTSLTFTGTAEPGTSVQLFVGGTPGGTAVAAAGTGAWTISAPGLAEGVHAITARATDGAGNAGPLSSARSVTIDLTAPAPPSAPDLDPASDSGASNVDNLTSQTALTFTGSAEAGATVQILVDGAAGPTAVADGVGAWTIVASPPPGAARAITARVTDLAGNVSAASGVLSVTVDTSAPPAPSVPDLDGASDTGTSASDNLTRLTAVTFSGTAEDGTTVQLLIDGVAGPTAAVTGGAWTIPASSLAPGVRAITARATDAAGNVGAASTALSVTIDTTAPAAPSPPDLADGSDTGASSTDNLTRLTALSFSGAAEAGASVQLFVDGAAGATAAGAAWTIAASPVAEGVHSITAVATDAAGNAGPASAALVVTVDLTPPAPASTPDLQASDDTGVSSTDNLTRLTSVTFTGSAEPTATVRLFVDGAGGAATAAAGGAWTLAATGLSSGVRQITAIATDAAGNAAAASAALAVTIDTQPPAVPSVPDLDPASDTGASTTDNLTSLTTLSFSGTADANVSVQLLVDGVAGGTATAAGGIWTIPAPSLASGLRSITARAADAAGNQSAASGALSVTIDASAPAPPPAPDLDAASDTGTSPTDNLTKLTTLSFSGAAESGSTVRLLVDGVEAGTTTAAAGAWTITASSLAPGARTMTAAALDPAGNLSPASAGLVVTIDATAPATPPSPVLDAGSDTGASATDGFTILHLLSFTGATEAGAAVRLFADGAPVGSVAADPGGNYTVGSSNLPDGTYAVTVTATDAAGNESAPSASLPVIIDNTAPPSGVVQDGPAADLAVQASATAILAHWSGFDDPQSGILRYEVAVGTSPGGAEIEGFADVGTATSATRGPFALVDGTTYYVTVRATNPVNLQSTSTSNGVTVDLQAPGPAGWLTAIPADGAATLSWTASLSGDVAFYRAWWKPANAAWSAATLVDNLAGLSAVLPGLANGVLHDFRLVAVDEAGNESTDRFASATPQPAIQIQGGGTFATIQAALDAALPGQTVVLGPGTFVGDLVLRPGVSLQGWSPQHTGVQGVVTVEGTFGSGLSSTISQLTVTGGATGITSASADLTVRNVVVHGVAGDGISAGAAGALAAINVTLMSNGGDGLRSLGVTIVRNAISGQNGGWGLNVPAAAAVTYSDAFGNTAGDFSAGGGGTGNFSLAAIFADAAAFDFTNPATSPTVDAGDPADDFSGEPAPNGGRIDLGAFGNTAWAPLTTTPVAPVTPSGGGGGGGGGGCGLTGLEGLLLTLFLALARKGGRAGEI